MVALNNIESILIANRGEIACRVIRSCKKLGVRSIAVFSDADRNMPFVNEADDSYHLGPSEAAQSYLNIEKIIAACRATGASAVHPGYGFLAENESFARQLEEAGIILIGPSPRTMQQMGDKISARHLMQSNGVPVVPGYDGDDQSVARLTTEAEKIGYPVMVKASAGGGGRGLRIVQQVEDLAEAIESARREASSAFGDDRIFIEKFIDAPRHIEIQIFGDSHNTILHLFERECSVQRRHQKVIEESPAPGLKAEVRDAMAKTAIDAARAVKYLGAGTVEFVYSDTDEAFYFLEMNTRLQVEHPVTEMVTNTDLVAEQIRVADGQPLSFSQAQLKQSGHAIEARIYAEDPGKGFVPSIGHIYKFSIESTNDVRIDSGVESGSEVSMYYDAMIAKLIVHAASRDHAIEKMNTALRNAIVFGPTTNLEFLGDVICSKAFQAGGYTTRFIEENFKHYRGRGLTPAEIENSRIIAGLLFYEGAARQMEMQDLARAEELSVARQGGDLAPYSPELDGFEIW